MKKISPIKYSVQCEKEDCYSFSSRILSDQLSEIREPQEHSLRTTVGMCVSFLFAPQRRSRKDENNSREEEKDWQMGLCLLLGPGSWCPSPLVCVCAGDGENECVCLGWGVGGGYKLFILKPVFFYFFLFLYYYNIRALILSVHLNEFLPRYIPS